MKKAAAALLAAALTLSACGAPAPSVGPSAASGSSGGAYAGLDAVELIGADSTGKGAAGQIFGQLVSARVDEITGGKLTIDYHPNGDLGGDADLLRQMQSNDIQLVVCQPAPVVSFIPEMAVFDLPMAFSRCGGDAIDRALNGAGDLNTRLSAAYEAAGFHLLGFLQNATYRLTTANRALPDPAAFAHLQIRTMENSNHMAFWTAIGAEPTPMAFSELYFSLQSGAVDAEENAADTIVGSNFDEVQDYLACTNHILYVNQICVSQAAYDALAPAYRAALEQAVAEALAEMRPQLTRIDADGKAALQNAGMTVIEYDDAFFDEILATRGVRELYASIDEATNGLGAVLQRALQAANPQ